MLKADDVAPDFILKDKEGNEVKLSDFKGKKVVLYFYPKDNTPGCPSKFCIAVSKENARQKSWIYFRKSAGCQTESSQPRNG